MIPQQPIAFGAGGRLLGHRKTVQDFFLLVLLVDLFVDRPPGDLSFAKRLAESLVLAACLFRGGIGVVAMKGDRGGVVVSLFERYLELVDRVPNHR